MARKGLCWAEGCRGQMGKETTLEVENARNLGGLVY